MGATARASGVPRVTCKRPVVTRHRPLRRPPPPKPQEAQEGRPRVTGGVPGGGLPLLVGFLFFLKRVGGTFRRDLPAGRSPGNRPPGTRRRGEPVRFTRRPPAGMGGPGLRGGPDSARVLATPCLELAPALSAPSATVPGAGVMSGGQGVRAPTLSRGSVCVCSAAWEVLTLRRQCAQASGYSPRLWEARTELPGRGVTSPIAGQRRPLLVPSVTAATRLPAVLSSVQVRGTESWRDVGEGCPEPLVGLCSLQHQPGA